MGLSPFRNGKFLLYASLAAFVAGFAGCGEYEPAGQPAAASSEDQRLDELGRQVHATLVDLPDLLGTIRDEASLQAAMPKLQDMIDRVRKLREEMNELTARGVRGTPQRAEQFKQDMDALGERVKREIARIRPIPGSGQIGMELFRALNPQAPPPGAAVGPAMAGGFDRGRDTELVGGSGGGPFRRVDPDGSPVIGFQYSPGVWMGQQAIGTLEPVFDRQTRPAPWSAILAREGYAVGALKVDAGEYVNAVQVVFMRVDGRRLDPNDSYTSQWIGFPTGKPTQTLGGSGAKVIGIHARRAAILDAIGLVLAEP